MQSNKTLMAALAGGLAFFLMGWLCYGQLMAGFLADNAGSATGVNKEPPEIWALALGDLGLGFFFTIAFQKMTPIPATIMDGMKSGAMMGLLLGASMDMMMYGMTNIMTLKGAVGDMITFTVVVAVGCGVIAWVLGRGHKAA